MTFEELLASSERNRKKKKYFPERWISVGYKPERAMEIARKYFEKTITPEEIKLLSNCCGWSIDFWIVRGYSEDEAKKEVYRLQSINSKKRLNKPKEERIHQYNTSIEYYLHKGMTIEEAEIARSNRQVTFSLEKCIQKYGEKEGLLIWETRQDQWQNTMNSKSPEEMEEINKKRNVFSLENLIRIHGLERGKIEYEKNMAHARRLGTTSKLSKSKESEKFFSIIEKICNHLNLNYHGGSTAEKQFCADDRAYRYDFLIPDINLVIEYNGVAWHAKENDYNFVSPKGVTYEEYWDYWNKKITFIKSQGYDVIEVFSDEKLKDRQCEINKEICRRAYESCKN